MYSSCGFLIKYALLHIIILFDLILLSITEFIISSNNRPKDILLILILIEYFLQLSMVLIQLAIITATIPFSIGYLKEFGWKFCLCIAANLLKFITFSIYVFFSFQIMMKTSDILWNDPLFTGIAILHRCITLVYYVFIIDAMQQAENIEWYTEEYWRNVLIKKQSSLINNQILSNSVLTISSSE